MFGMKHLLHPLPKRTLANTHAHKTERNFMELFFDWNEI